MYKNKHINVEMSIRCPLMYVWKLLSIPKAKRFIKLIYELLMEPFIKWAVFIK